MESHGDLATRNSVQMPQPDDGCHPSCPVRAVNRRHGGQKNRHQPDSDGEERVEGYRQRTDQVHLGIEWVPHRFNKEAQPQTQYHPDKRSNGTYGCPLNQEDEPNTPAEGLPLPSISRCSPACRGFA